MFLSGQVCGSFFFFFSSSPDIKFGINEKDSIFFVSSLFLLNLWKTPVLDRGLIKFKIESGKKKEDL